MDPIHNVKIKGSMTIQAHKQGNKKIGVYIFQLFPILSNMWRFINLLLVYYLIKTGNYKNKLKIM